MPRTVPMALCTVPSPALMAPSTVALCTVPFQVQPNSTEFSSNGGAVYSPNSIAYSPESSPISAESSSNGTAYSPQRRVLSQWCCIQSGVSVNSTESNPNGALMARTVPTEPRKIPSPAPTVLSPLTAPTTVPTASSSALTAPSAPSSLAAMALSCSECQASI